MTCDLSIGRLRPCKNSIGGVAKLFLYNLVQDPFTVVNGVVTAINPLLTQVFEYEIEGDGHTLTQNFVSNSDTGTAVNTQTTVILLKKIDAQTSAQLNLLAYGRTMAVVKDRNGVYMAIGIDDARGIDWTIDSATGSAKTEMNGYTLTGVSTTRALSPKLDSATVTAFLNLVAPTITGGDTVKVGGSIILIGSGSPAVSGTWSSSVPANATVNSSNTNTVYVTGVAVGTTVITYTDLNGETATKTITVEP